MNESLIRNMIKVWGNLMTEKEIIEHELIKNALKIYISNNQS